MKIKDRSCVFPLWSVYSAAAEKHEISHEKRAERIEEYRRAMEKAENNTYGGVSELVTHTLPRSAEPIIPIFRKEIRMRIMPIPDTFENAEHTE